MSNPPPESNGPDVFDEADRIIILTPCFDRHSTTDYNESLALCKQFPLAKFRMADGTVQLLPVVAASIWFSNESHIDRARNSLLYQFEQKHYRFGLFMDADQPFEPDQIASLWRHLINGVRVVCGLVALKSIVPTFVCNTLAGERPDPTTGLMRIKDGGTGCMAFNRNILTEFREKWPAYVHQKLANTIDSCRGGDQFCESGIDKILHALSECGLSADISFTGNLNTCCAGRTAYAYFASGVTHRDGRGDWLSEDWMLCHRLQLLGIPIYADVSVNLKHLGRQLFPPPPEEIIEAALRVTSGNNPPFSRGLSQAASQVLTALHQDINDQSITVLHATRGRPDKALRARELFIKRAGAPVEYIFGLDSDDTTCGPLLKYPHRMLTTTMQGDLEGRRLSPPGIVAAINAAASAATGRILVMAADDCVPPENWAVSVRAAFAGQLHEPRVLMTSDGYSNQQLIPHPIMTRAFYQEQGYFFCPEYPHLFCDTELTVRALALGRVIDAKHLVFKHENPMFTGEKPDAMAVERNSKEAWAAGEAIFKRRNTAPPDGIGTIDFGDFYRQMVELAVDGSVFVELGAYLGGSAAFMLEEIARTGKKIDFRTFDTFVMRPKWKEEAAYIAEHGGTVEAACRHTIRTRTGQDPDKVVFKLDSAAAAQGYADASVDFCFIDADHSEAAVLRDIAAWLPKIKPGRILAGHDFDMPEVYRAVMKSLGGKYMVKQTGRVWFILLPPAAP